MSHNNQPHNLEESIFLSDEIQIIEKFTIVKENNFFEIFYSSFKQIFDVIYPYAILIPVILFAIGMLYTNRPKLNERIILSHIDAKEKKRVVVYNCKIWWGWKKFPWQYIPKSQHLGKIRVNLETECKYFYNTRIDDERPLSDSCIEEKEKTENKIISFKDRNFFLRERIKTFQLITSDSETSNFESKIKLRFFLKKDDPILIKVENSNPISVKRFLCVLDKKQTSNIVSRLSNCENYIEMINAESVSYCKIIDDKLNILINTIPKKSENIDGITIVNLS